MGTLRDFLPPDVQIVSRDLERPIVELDEVDVRTTIGALKALVASEPDYEVGVISCERRALEKFRLMLKAMEDLRG